MAKDFPRRGAWATLGDRVGIIHEYPQVNVAIDPETSTRTETRDPLSAEVHFTNESGETAETVRGIPVASLSQARLADIPAPRRPDAGVAALLGYE